MRELMWLCCLVGTKYPGEELSSRVGSVLTCYSARRITGMLSD